MGRTRPCAQQLALVGPGTELQLTLDGRAVPHGVVVAERSAPAAPSAAGVGAAQGVTRTIRSSSSVGSPRPSRLEVVTQSDPSGAAAGVRRRP